MGIKNTSASLGSFQEKPYINAREYVYLKYCTPVALIVCVCVFIQIFETTKLLRRFLRRINIDYMSVVSVHKQLMDKFACKDTTFYSNSRQNSHKK